MIQFRCFCGKSLKAKPALAGRKVKCPGCGVTVPVPSRALVLLRSLAITVAVLWVAAAGLAMVVGDPPTGVAVAVGSALIVAGTVVAGLLARRLNRSVPAWSALALLLPVIGLPWLALLKAAKRPAGRRRAPGVPPARAGPARMPRALLMAQIGENYQTPVDRTVSNVVLIAKFCSETGISVEAVKNMKLRPIFLPIDVPHHIARQAFLQSVRTESPSTSEDELVEITLAGKLMLLAPLY